MAKIIRKVRYFVAKPGARDPATGVRITRHYWQPTPYLRENGWRTQRLSNVLDHAIAKAEKLNAEVDAWYAKGRGPRAAGRRGLGSRRRKQGVYIVRNGDDRVKIGIAADPQKRVRDMQVGNGRELELMLFFRPVHANAAAIESAVHIALQDRRTAGEWFAMSVSDALMVTVRHALRLDADAARAAENLDTVQVRSGHVLNGFTLTR